jgi:hypothetical protein
MAEQKDQYGPLPGQAIIRSLKPDYVSPAATPKPTPWSQNIKTPQSGPSVGQPRPMPGGVVRGPGNDD